MITADHLALIGKPGVYYINGIKIRIVIKNIRSVWGRTDYLIRPDFTGAQLGLGEEEENSTWVSADKIRLL